MIKPSEQILRQKQQSISSNNKEHSQNSRNRVPNQLEPNTLLPLTHIKKKKKHRKKIFRKHSPDYYEELKLKKINKKLEQKWDNHFINDQIPDFLSKKKVQRKTLSKIVVQKRSTTAMNNRLPSNKTADINTKNQALHLPKVQKANKRSKSFNIHVLTTKQMEPKSYAKKEEQESQIEKQVGSQLKQKPQKSGQQSKKIILEKHSGVQQYKEKLNQVFGQNKFLHCHKEMLEHFFEKISKKNVEETINKELVALKNKQSIIYKVMTAIQNRQKFLSQVKSSIISGETTQNKLCELVDLYRTSTLVVVEEILKWKEIWQAFYFQVFKKKVVFDLVYKTDNYLLSLDSSVNQIFQKVNQGKSAQKKQTKHTPANSQINTQQEIQNKANTQSKTKIQVKGNQQTKINQSKIKQNKSDVQNKLKKQSKINNEDQVKTENQKKTETKPNQSNKINQSNKVNQSNKINQINKVNTENKKIEPLDKKSILSDSKQKKQSPHKNNTENTIKSTQKKPDESSPNKPNNNQQINLVAPSEQKSIKQEKISQIAEPKIATQQQKIGKLIQKMVPNDPFLISLYSIEKEDKNIILKIRACQLLLIEQQFIFLKN